MWVNPYGANQPHQRNSPSSLRLVPILGSRWEWEVAAVQKDLSVEAVAAFFSVMMAMSAI